MSQLRQFETELDTLGVIVKVIAFDSESMAKAYVQQSNLKWPMILDKDAHLYRAYGMTRGSWWSIYNPLSILKYIKLILTRKRPGRPGRDWRQLGGDILIDPHGNVRVHHVSIGPHDRPTPQFLLDIIKSAPSDNLS